MKKFFVYIILIFCGNTLFTQNYAIRFFGNGVDDVDRIKIRIDNPEKNADIGMNFTIEFLMKCNLNDNQLGANVLEGNNDDWVLGHIIVDRDIFGSGDYGDYGISLANGRIAFGVNNGTDSYTLIGNTFVADNNWHFIAVTRNHSTGKICILVDGVIDKCAETNVTGDISYRNNRNTDWKNDPYIVLGAETHDYDNNLYPSYNGFLDELRISNIIRYTENYNPTYYLNDDINTMALYHFDEGEGNILYDAALISGNNSNGVIHFGGTPTGTIWVENDISSNILGTQLKHRTRIFPNPSNGQFSLQLEDIDCQTLKIKVYSTDGKLLTTRDLSGANGEFFAKFNC